MCTHLPHIVRLAILLAVGCGEVLPPDNSLPEQPSGSVVVSGSGYACTLRGGRALCWGDNRSRIVPQLTTAVVAVPTQVAGVADATALAVGDGHVCALHDSGGVSCWGLNGRSQLGVDEDNNDTVGKVIAVDLPSPASQLALGSNHSCALLVDGAVWCWGRNDSAQLGRNHSMPDERAPAPVRILDAPAVAIGAAGSSSCAATASKVRCWGANSDGHLGGEPQPDPVLAGIDMNLAGVTVLSLADSHGCAIAAHQLWCWGPNSWGEVGLPPNQPARQPVLVVDDALLVATAPSHTCVVTGDRKLSCWGLNVSGLVGDGTTEIHSTPTPVAGVTDVVAVAIGTDQVSAGATCVNQQDGSLWCWGYGPRGIIGNGHTATLVPTATRVNASQIAVGGSHSCAIVENQSAVMCWGSNRFGELGDGTTTSRATPQRVSLSLPDNVQVAELALGTHHSCVRLSDRSVRCWGSNSDNQLAVTGDQRELPTLPSTIGLVDRVVAGGNTTCVLANQDAICWGANQAARQPGSVPSTVRTPTKLVDLVAGGSHVCGRGVDGRAVCWGANDFGQLGAGDNSPSNDARSVVDLVGIQALSAGPRGTCAELAAVPPIWCWGDASYSVFDTTTPTPDELARSPVASASSGLLSLGDSVACRADNATCWGSNAVGLLANGTFDSAITPRSMVGISGPMTRIAFGANHACALVGDEVYCWGDNRSGEIAQPDLTLQLLPIHISL